MLRVFVLTIAFVLSVQSLSYAERKAVIKLPSDCYDVDRADCKKDTCRIYLKKATKECLNTPMYTQIGVSSDTREAEIYIDGKYKETQKLQKFNTGVLTNLFDRADRMSKTLNTKQCKNKEAETAAKDLNEYFHSEQYQAKLRAEQERIKKEVLPHMKGYREYEKKSKKQSPAGVLGDDERIYLFISSSVPESVLRRYVRDIAELNEPNIKIVMRGFIGGVRYLKPTMKYIAGLLKKDENCDMLTEQCEVYRINIDIDPLLFRRYGIDRVPAVVYVDGIKKVGVERSEGSEKGYRVTGDVYKVYGDASFKYMIKFINREARKKSLDSLIEKFNRGFYQGKS